MLMMLCQGPPGQQPRPVNAHDGQLMLMMLRQGPHGPLGLKPRPADVMMLRQGSQPKAQAT